VDERHAEAIAEHWSGGSGLVPRGPRQLLAYFPATPADVERHTGRRPTSIEGLWRLEVSGRFLRSGGLVYPGGVPYPEELHNQTAVIANEVWLYVDQESGRVLGSYWWPDAVRRPIASPPRDEYPASSVMDPRDASAVVDFELRVPQRPPWDAAIAVCLNPREVIVFCVTDTTPDPLHEMLLFEQGGLSLRATAEDRAEDISSFLRSHSPPFRQVRVGSRTGAGRDPGRALGPQTWPWPGELHWWDAGVTYELKGFVPLSTLLDVAGSMTPVAPA
jgi:hypothetical protein